MGAQRLSKKKIKAKKTKLQEAIETESTLKDVRMSDEGLDGLDGSLCKIYPSGIALRSGKNSGVHTVVTDFVSLKVVSWNVVGLAEDSRDIFFSQISMLTDWDVL